MDSKKIKNNGLVSWISIVFWDYKISMEAHRTVSDCKKKIDYKSTYTQMDTKTYTFTHTETPTEAHLLKQTAHTSTQTGNVSSQIISG